MRARLILQGKLSVNNSDILEGTIKVEVCKKEQDEQTKDIHTKIGISETTEGCNFIELQS